MQGTMTQANGVYTVKWIDGPHAANPSIHFFTPTSRAGSLATLLAMRRALDNWCCSRSPRKILGEDCYRVFNTRSRFERRARAGRVQ